MHEGISLLILSILAVTYVLLLRCFNLLPNFRFFDREMLRKKTDERIYFFDFAKGVAIIAVVIIHVVFFMMLFPENFSTKFFEWNQHINRAMRFAIPVFFISSGALLYLKDLKKETLKRFYYPKITRILFPYALFSLLSTSLFTSGFDNFGDYMIVAFKDFFTGTALVPYWFIPVLFKLYLLYPLLWYLFVVKKVNPAIILGGSFLFSLASFFLFSPSWFGWHSYLGGLVFFGDFLFLFVLGMILRPFFFTGVAEAKNILEKIRFKHFAYTVVLLYFFIGFLNPLELYFNSRLIYGPVVTVLLFLAYSLLKDGTFTKIFEKIGEQSLYIYLLHFWFFHFFYIVFIHYNFQRFNSLAIFISLFIANLVLTCGFIFLIQKMYRVVFFKPERKTQK